MDGIHRTDKDPDLDHVSGFPIVAGGFETGGDDHAVAILVENESVHWTPPRIASTRSQTIAPTMRKPKASNARADSRDWSRFMGLFVERIGRGDGENEVDDEMPFVAVAVLSDMD